MDSYGIKLSRRDGTRKYTLDAGQTDRWDLEEAEEIAQTLFGRNTDYVSIGNGEHEFRRWREGATSAILTDTSQGPRWAEWYVDVEINGNRWQYRPLNDLDTYDAADALAEEAATLAPVVTRVWVGHHPSGEESVWDTHEG